MNITSDFEKRLLDALKESKVVEHVLMKSVLDEMNSEILKKLLAEAMPITIKDSELVFTTKEDEEIRCPNFSASISNDGKWLSDKIPNVSFDIEQGGNLRKAEEAESAYCCCIVNMVLDDEIFREELDKVIKEYNYDQMDGIVAGKNFKNLLISWQDLQSVMINVCISAAKYKIANVKKDTEKFLRDGIPEDMVIELRSLETKIKDINRLYSTGVLSPLNVKHLTKIEVLKKLEEKNVNIENEIKTSNVETLYRILNLSSEYISPIVKKRLRKIVNLEIEKLYSENSNLSSMIGEKTVILDRWKRRYVRLAKISVRKAEVEKYFSSKGDYLLPKKQ